jgi:hypothetical protein
MHSTPDRQRQSRRVRKRARAVERTSYEQLGLRVCAELLPKVTVIDIIAATVSGLCGHVAKVKHDVLRVLAKETGPCHRCLTRRAVLRRGVVRRPVVVLQLPPQLATIVAPCTGKRLRAVIWIATSSKVRPVRGLRDVD